MFKRTIISAVLLFLPACALAAESGNPAIRAAIEKFIDAQDISGAVTVVVSKDKVLALDTIGLADIAKKKPMEPDTLFWLASMTKPLTGISILMLQDEGKLKVSDPVEKFIPEFAALKTPAGQPAHITIEQILTHTSGLGEGDAAAIKSAHTLADLIPIYLASPMLYEPGDHWRYTQSGINVAARIVEVASGLSFDDFVSKRILKPLGMKNTTFYPNKKQRSHLATPYIKDKQTGYADRGALRRLRKQGATAFRQRGAFLNRPGLRALLPDAVERRYLQGQALSQPCRLSRTHHRAHRRTQDRLPANRRIWKPGNELRLGNRCGHPQVSAPRCGGDAFAGHLRSWRSLGHPGMDRPGARPCLHPHGAAPGHQRRRQQASPSLPTSGLRCFSEALISVETISRFGLGCGPRQTYDAWRIYKG